VHVDGALDVEGVGRDDVVRGRCDFDEAGCLPGDRGQFAVCAGLGVGSGREHGGGECEEHGCGQDLWHW
jgi:hypothetical protein